jgi:HD-GYP domain-containing protein (c-di-GMP phosphodiesterase class II)
MTNTSSYQQKLFIQLSIIMIFVMLAVGGTTYFFDLKHIQSQIIKKVTLHSTSTANDYMHNSSQMKHTSSKIQTRLLAQNNNFLFFSIKDNKGHLLVEEKSPEYATVKQLLNNKIHTIDLKNSQGIVTQFIHAHFNNKNYLDLFMPILLQDKSIGKLHAFWDITDSMRELRHNMIKNLIEALLIIFIIFLTMYPTILSLNRNLLNKTKKLAHSNQEILNLLGGAIAKRDSDTHAHNYRVTLYALTLAQEINLNPNAISALIKGSFLHDVGKIGISDTILLKPGKLTSEEFRVMKQHVDYGVEIINNSVWLQDAKDVVAYHHEKYDGSGYPKGLTAESIPLNARIFAIADVFDALTSKRPYKKAFSFNIAHDIMQKSSATHFDPKLLHSFFQVITPLYKEIQNNHSENYLKKLLEENIKQYIHL